MYTTKATGVLGRQEQAVDGVIMTNANQKEWSADHIGKRASRLLFQDLALGIITNVPADVLPKVLLLK